MIHRIYRFHQLSGMNINPIFLNAQNDVLPKLNHTTKQPVNDQMPLKSLIKIYVSPVLPLVKH